MADDPVAQLYGLPLNDFVPGRNALARELRRAGHKEHAAEVAALKRPSVAAWAVNQLARRDPKELDLLLDAGHRLRTGQEEALKGGDRGKFEAARTDHDRAVRELTAAARELLASERGTVSDQMLASIERTLRYASIDDEERAVLASGRLTEEVDAPGFGAFASMALPATPPSTPKAGRAPSAKHGVDRAAERAARKARLAEAQAALKLARERERDARQEVRAAERAEREAAKEHERATGELEEARAAADAAAAAVQDATDRVEAERAG
ncbi:MAG: hypothetical protein ACJ79R_19765 [Anaeromyxobacteraceae bacterium]